MEHRTIFALLLSAALTAPAMGNTPHGIPPNSATAVQLTGWLHADDLHMEDILVEVEVDGLMHYATLSGTGRFTVSLPPDTEALLRFEKPGHLTKEIRIDTRHVQDGGRSDRPRKVHFAVIMEREEQAEGYLFQGPVGSIAFEQGGGCLAVGHHRTFKANDAPKPMVF